MIDLQSDLLSILTLVQLLNLPTLFDLTLDRLLVTIFIYYCVQNNLIITKP